MTLSPISQGTLQNFICPIRLEEMKQAVIDREGHSFEEEAIYTWLQTSSYCPIDHKPLSIHELTPNYALMGAIADFHRYVDEQTIAKDSKASATGPSTSLPLQPAHPAEDKLTTESLPAENSLAALLGSLFEGRDLSQTEQTQIDEMLESCSSQELEAILPETLCKQNLTLDEAFTIAKTTRMVNTMARFHLIAGLCQVYKTQSNSNTPLIVF